VWVAAHLARNDNQIGAGTKDRDTVEAEAREAFGVLVAQGPQEDELASKVYALFTTGVAASKAVAAQYLAEGLENRNARGELAAEALKAKLPVYLVTAIEHVSAAPTPA
jgi:putative ATP-dependent endonuclease of OLD family